MGITDGSLGGGGTGLTSIANKAIVNNGAAVTYAYPSNTSYVYLTSTAVALQITLPAASASIEGLVIEIVLNTTVATATWVSTGATFVGAPSAFAGNTPVKMIYDHATLKWYPA